MQRPQLTTSNLLSRTMRSSKSVCRQVEGRLQGGKLERQVLKEALGCFRHVDFISV